MSIVKGIIYFVLGICVILAAAFSILLLLAVDCWGYDNLAPLD